MKLKKLCIFLLIIALSMSCISCFKPILEGKRHPENFVGSTWASTDGVFKFSGIKQKKIEMSDSSYNTLLVFAVGECLINGETVPTILENSPEIIYILVYLADIENVAGQELGCSKMESEFFVADMLCSFRSKTHFKATVEGGTSSSPYFESGQTFEFYRTDV